MASNHTMPEFALLLVSPLKISFIHDTIKYTTLNGSTTKARKNAKAIKIPHINITIDSIIRLEIWFSGAKVSDKFELCKFLNTYLVLPVTFPHKFKE